MRAPLPRTTLALALAASLLAARARAGEADGEPPTFARDVAPIVWQRCAACHREGASAPFPLTSYEEVRRRAKQIAIVTRTGIMPPWLPEPGLLPLRDERRLSAAERDTLARWAEAGAPLGDAQAVPPLPDWPVGWQLGEPDLVVQFPAEGAFELAPDGPDLFRNLVVRVPLERARWVRAFELRPEGSAAIHHARLQLDRTDSCRRLDASDPLPGFSGMGMGASAPPDGQPLGWTPGKAARFAPEGTAWELVPGGDLVLQLHLTPTGKPEPVRPRIGLYFADAPPERELLSVLLFSEDIFVPAGAKGVRVEDEIVLSAPAQLLAIYPHAHYLGRSVVLTVEQNGRVEDLFAIEDWDFDWQDEYQLATPVRLEAGARLRMTWTFDNSADNPRNPHDPPRPVRYGLESSDEMATLSLTFLPSSERGLGELRVMNAEHALARRPQDPELASALGMALLEAGRDEEAERLLGGTLARSGTAVSWTNLGLARMRRGQSEQAAQAFERALAIDDRYAPANLQYGRALIALGHSKKALNHYKAALERRSEMSDVRADWASLLALTGRTGSAIRQFELVLEAEPDNAGVHNNLANALAAAGRGEDAVAHYRRAIALHPDLFDAQLNLGRTLLDLGRASEALEPLRAAQRLRPDDASAQAELRRASGR